MDPEQYLFFQLLTSSLEPILDSATPEPKAILETTLIATLRGLQELLRREQRAAFHDHLPGLISSIEDCVAIAGIDAHSVTFHVFRKSIAELRAIVGRATGLLQQDGEPKIDAVSTQLSRPPPIPKNSSYHNTATIVTTNGTSQRPRSFPSRQKTCYWNTRDQRALGFRNADALRAAVDESVHQAPSPRMARSGYRGGDCGCQDGDGRLRYALRSLV